jgi:hypothetical protein
MISIRCRIDLCMYIWILVLYMNGSPTTENICLGIVFVVWIYEWVRFSYWGNIWMVAGPVQTTVTPLYPMAAKKTIRATVPQLYYNLDR